MKRSLSTANASEVFPDEVFPVAITELADDEDLSLLAEICSRSRDQDEVNAEQAVPVADDNEGPIYADGNSQDAVDADFFAAHCQDAFVSKQLNQSPNFDENFRPELAETEILPEIINVGENELDPEEAPEPILPPKIFLSLAQKAAILHAPPKKVMVSLPFDNLSFFVRISPFLSPLCRHFVPERFFRIKLSGS